MLNYCVTLRDSEEYCVDDVISLCMQVKKYLKVPHEFVCYTDTPINHKLVREIPLKYNWPSSWATLEMWNNQGPTILTGLDTIILSDIDRLGEIAMACKKDQIYMCRPRNPRMKRLGFWATGITIWNGDFSWIVKDFNFKETSRIWRWEQMFVSQSLKDHGITPEIIQDLIPGWYSYKVLRKTKQNMKQPKNASIITFAGHPRPRQCTEDWIISAYNTYKTWEYTIPLEELHHELGQTAKGNEGLPQNLFDNSSQTESSDIRNEPPESDETDSHESTKGISTENPDF